MIAHLDVVQISNKIKFKQVCDAVERMAGTLSSIQTTSSSNKFQQVCEAVERMAGVPFIKRIFSRMDCKVYALPFQNLCSPYTTFVHRLCATTAHSENLALRAVPSGIFLNLRKTAYQKCGAFPRRTRI